MKIHFVTTNRGKFLTAKATLGKYSIEIIHEPVEIPEIRAETVEEVALDKAMWAWQKLSKPLFVIDAGLHIPSLNGFPGPFSKFALEKIGIEGMLRLTERKKTPAYFIDALAYMDETLDKPKLFTAKIHGVLISEPRGEAREYAWSDYFYIFKPEGVEKTLAEMSENEYARWRENLHTATEAFGKWLAKKANGQS